MVILISIGSISKSIEGIISGIGGDFGVGDTDTRPDLEFLLGEI